MEDERRKLALQALGNLREKRLDEAQKARINTPDKSRNLAQGALDKDVLRASGGSMSADVTEPIMKMNVGTEKIDTKQVTPITSGSDFAERQATRSLKGDLRATARAAAEAGDTDTLKKLKQIAEKMSKKASKAAKVIPGVGAVMALAGAEDASAAVPLLDQADSVGMSASEEDQLIAERDAMKDYGKSPASRDRAAALAKLVKNRQ